MATTRTNKVEVEITATDEATPKIERLEKKIDGLESDEARIIVTAQTDRLEKQLDTAKAKLDGLDGDEATVQLRAIGNLESDLDQARTLLAKLDGKTGTVKINAVDTASGDIDRVDQKRRDLDGKTATVKLDSTGSLGNLGKAAGAAGLAAGLTDAVLSANQLAGQVQQVADATGAPLDKASRLVSVWEQNGLEVSDLLDIIFQVNGALQQQPELAGQLGVNIGGNQDLIDTFLQSVEGVGTAYENVSDRQIAASALFGEEGVRQIGAVTTSVGDLQTAMDNLPEAQTIDADSVQRWRDTNAEIVEFKGHLLEVQLFLSEEILPVVNDIADAIGGFVSAVKDLADWVSGPDISGTDIANVFDDNNQSRVNAVAAGNTNGFFGGAFGAIRAPVGTTAHVPQVTVINPPGTPATVVNADRVYQRRNGAQ